MRHFTAVPLLFQNFGFKPQPAGGVSQRAGVSGLLKTIGEILAQRHVARVQLLCQDLLLKASCAHLPDAFIKGAVHQNIHARGFQERCLLFKGCERFFLLESAHVQREDHRGQPARLLRRHTGEEFLMTQVQSVKFS